MLAKTFYQSNIEAFGIVPSKDAVEILDRSRSSLLETRDQDFPTLLVDGRPIHSKHSPEKEARRLLESVETFNEREFLIFCGCGLGHAVRLALLESKAKIIWMEPDREILYPALSIFDFSPYAGRMTILTDIDPLFKTDDTIEELFKGKSNLNTAILSLRSMVREGGIYYNLHERLVRFLNRKDANRATLTKFNSSWSRNLSLNLFWLRNARPVSDLYGSVAAETPVVVCGAGPSLTDSLSALALYRKKYILIAVDTAVAVLQSAGIDPDFILSVDPQAINSYYLHQYVGEARIIFDPTTTSLTLKNLQTRPLFFYQSPFPLFRLVQSALSVEAGEISSGGSVSTNAYDLAVRLGSKRIYFVGQDLSFTDGLAHCKGALLEERLNFKENRVFRREAHNYAQLSALPTRELPALHSGRPVRTNDKLVIFQRWLSARILTDRKAGIRVINATIRGAVIEGAIPGSLDFAKASESVVVSPLRQNTVSVERLQNGVSHLLDDILFLGEQLLTGLRILESFLQKKETSVDGISKVNKELKFIDIRIKEKQFALEVLGSAAQRTIQEIQEPVGNPGNTDAYRTTGEIYRALFDSCENHIKWLELTLARFENE